MFKTHFATKLEQLKEIGLVGKLIFSFFCLVLLIVSYSPLAISLEQSSGLPLLYSLRGPIEPPNNIAIIALNSAAAHELQLSNYSGNWPRTLHAQLLQKLKHAHARLVVMDIAFKDEHSEQEDAALEKALKESANVILFTYLKRQQLSTGAGMIDIEQEIPPIPRFRQHALTSASFTLAKYPAKVYSTHLLAELSGGTTASQPLMAYLATQTLEDQQLLWDQLKIPQPLSQDLNRRSSQLISQRNNMLPSQLNGQAKRIAEVFTAENPVFIHFYGYPNTLPTWSIDDALSLDEKQFNQTFQGKTVYIGYSDTVQTEQQDAYRTVFSNQQGVDISGVEISATVFSNLVDHTFIRKPTALTLLAITIAAIVFCFISYQLPFTWNICTQLSVSLAYLFIVFYAFSHQQLWLPLILPLLALLLSNAYKFARRMSIDKRRIRHIQFTLSQYLPNEAAAKLSKSVTVLEQQRQLVYGVCLMTDIQGYTRLAETLAPDELHQLMNVYYSELVSAVEAHGGFIGNLVGDGMLALWTGPEITPLMCQQALLASQEIQQRINNNVLLKQQLPTCSALHGGQFSLGNLGAKGHFEYSPVGDIINTASRVEHFNRNLGTQFLCTETIAKQLMLLPNPIALRLLGHFTFRHKSMAMALYGLAQGLSEELLNTYEQALSAYTQTDFDFAKQHFEQLFNLYQDGPSQYYLDELNKESSNDSAIQN